MKKISETKPATSKANTEKLTDFQEKLTHQNSAVLKLSALFLKGKKCLTLLLFLGLFSINGFAQEIEIKGNSVVIVDGDETPSLSDDTYFGGTKKSGGTISKTFTIKNTGSSTLELTGTSLVEIKGIHKSSFSISSGPNSYISGGTSSDFTVEFDPTIVGVNEAYLYIVNNDANETYYTFYISGVGLSTTANTIEVSSSAQFGANINGVDDRDYNGASVSLSQNGLIMAIGTTSGGLGGVGETKVYEMSNGKWTKLGNTISGESTHDFSGNSISLSNDGTIVAIGAYNNRNLRGHVRVYQYINGVWTQLGSDIDGEATGDRSGGAISLSGDGKLVAIGAILNDDGGNDAGHVRVYKYSGSSWTQMGNDLDGSAASDYFGFSVSLSNAAILAVGAPGNGLVKVFEFNDGGWNQLGSTINGAYYSDECGASVSLSDDGSRLAIGSERSGGNGTATSDRGQVKVYDYNGSSWTQLGNAISGVADDDHFGSSVCLNSNGKILAISSTWHDNKKGHVRVFKYGSSSWSQIGSDIDGDSNNDRSGTSIALSGDGATLAIGAPHHDIFNFGFDRGRVKAYRFDEPTISMKGNDIIINNEDESPRVADFTDFEEADVTNDLITKTFKIFNTGVVSLSLTGSPKITITGDNADQFSITNQPSSSSIAIGDDLSFTVTFNPTSSGSKEAYINCESNDLDRSEFKFKIRGTGVYQIKNGGSTSTTQNECTISSSANSGFALQDVGDKVVIKNETGSTGETSSDIPQNTLVVKRLAKEWKLEITDDATTSGGLMTIAFQLANVNSDYSYYLLERTGTSGDFSVVNNINYEVDGNEVLFTVDLNTLTSNNYYTVGWSNAGPGNCLDLDGTDDYISLNSLSSSLAGGNATFEGWFHAANNNDILFAINTSSGGNKCMLNRNKIWDKTANAAINHTKPVTDALWHHYALVIDATNSVKVYIDGALANSFSSSALSLTSTNQISIGQEWDGLTTSQHLEGKVDEVRVWNDIRTQDEINDNMFTTLLGNEAGLVSYYKFDQNAESYLPDVAAKTNQGALVDFALSGTTSNWVASTAPIVSKADAKKLIGPGNALDLAGDDDVVNLTSILDPSASDWSFEAWIYPEDLSNTYHVLLSQKNGTGTGETYLTFENATPKLILGPNKKAADPIATNKWYHVAVTYDLSETKQTLYLDGIKLLENVGAISAADGILVLGRNNSGSNYFNGKVDDLRFWSSCRTQTEIQDNMYAGLNGDETNLMAYYNFNHSSGSVLEDITGNGNDGDLKNFSGTYWKSAASREPFKTVRAGTHGSGSTWKGGTAPSSNSDKMAVFHDLTVSSTGTYARMHVNSGTTITANADITVSGEVIINGTAIGSNKIIMNGSAKQCLGGSGTMGALQINNNNDVSLEGDLTISGALTLTSGDIELNDHNLTLTGTTSHGSSSSYLKLNGSGKVKQSVGSSAVIFPVGRNPYLPVIIQGGGNAEYSVGLTDRVYENPETQTNKITNVAVSETWTIQGSSTANNVSITLGWDVSEEQSSFDRNACGIGYWESGVDNSWNPGALAAATGSGPYFREVTLSSTSTNLYYFGVGDASSPLPVELTHFSAQWQTEGESALLTWQTATETNNSHFLIERSFDGVEFQTIGQVEGMGTTITSTDYQFDDPLETNNPNPETIYYRLKQVDFNGDYEYSDMKTLSSELETSSSFSVWPNPSSGDIVLVSAVGDYSVISMNGVVLKSFNNTDKLDISDLEKGTYMIRNKNGNHRILINL